MSAFGNKEIFATNLKRYMEINNIDRNKLAELMNLSYTTINEWFTATSYPRVDKISKLAQIFNITKSELIEDASTLVGKGIPIIGRIPAGMPFEAIEEAYTTDYIKIPKNWNKNVNNYFALQIVGNSMEPNYKDGDAVVFKRSFDEFANKDCCVLIGNEDATFKRVTITNDGLLLSPLNINNDSGFIPKLYSKYECENLPIKIIGVAEMQIKKL